MSEEQNEEKKHAASARKLRQQREQGSVPNAQDLASLAGAVAGLATLIALGAGVWQAMAEVITLSSQDLALPFDVAAEAGLDRLRSLLVRAVLPIVAAAAVVGTLVGLLYNGGLVVSIKPITPQMTRLSPSTNLKRILGRRGWIETAVAAARLALWIIAASLVIALWAPTLFRAIDCLGSCQANLVAPPFWLLTIAAAAVMLLAIAADMVIQRSLFLHEQRMTDTELKRERKDQSGNPEIRGERRRRTREGSGAAGSVGLDRANMCFFWRDRGVAVRFSPPEAPLPRITAKARSTAELALMRAAIRKAGFPEQESQTVVEVGSRADLGGILDQAAFQAFGQALRQMFRSRPGG